MQRFSEKPSHVIAEFLDSSSLSWSVNSLGELCEVILCECRAILGLIRLHTLDLKKTKRHGPRFQSLPSFHVVVCLSGVNVAKKAFLKLLMSVRQLRMNIQSNC